MTYAFCKLRNKIKDNRDCKSRIPVDMDNMTAIRLRTKKLLIPGEVLLSFVITKNLAF